MALGIGSSFSLAAATRDSAATAPASTSIPWSQIGAKAGADYQGDGLAISPTTVGARLRCVFQRLEAEATREGCWLTSTATAAVNDRFRIVAVALGREPNVARPSRLRVNGRLRTAPLRTTRRRPNSQARTPALRLKSRSRAPAQWKWRKTSPALFGPDLPKNTA